MTSFVKIEWRGQVVGSEKSWNFNLAKAANIVERVDRPLGAGDRHADCEVCAVYDLAALVGASGDEHDKGDQEGDNKSDGGRAEEVG